MEKFNANFVKVSDKNLLDIIKRGNHGFGSTGFGVIKKLKKDPESELTTSGRNQTISQKSYKLLEFVINQVMIYKLVLKKQ